MSGTVATEVYTDDDFAELHRLRLIECYRVRFLLARRQRDFSRQCLVDQAFRYAPLAENVTVIPDAPRDILRNELLSGLLVDVHIVCDRELLLLSP